MVTKPKLDEGEVKRLLKESEEQDAIRSVSPTRKQLAEALGYFKTAPQVRTYEEREDGSSTVRITNEAADAQENLERFSTYIDMTSGKREKEIARSHRREADTDHVTVYDARTGEAREVPARQEARVARKKWARASRGRVYVGFGRARN